MATLWSQRKYQNHEIGRMKEWKRDGKLKPYDLRKKRTPDSFSDFAASENVFSFIFSPVIWVTGWKYASVFCKCSLCFIELVIICHMAPANVLRFNHTKMAGNWNVKPVSSKIICNRSFFTLLLLFLLFFLRLTQTNSEHCKQLEWSTGIPATNHFKPIKCLMFTFAEYFEHWHVTALFSLSLSFCLEKEFIGLGWSELKPTVLTWVVCGTEASTCQLFII